jgi:hypothetical protein
MPLPATRRKRGDGFRVGQPASHERCALAETPSALSLCPRSSAYLIRIIPGLAEGIGLRSNRAAMAEGGSMDGGPCDNNAKEQIVLPGIEDGPVQWSPDRRRDWWIEQLRAALGRRLSGAPIIADAALSEYPGHPELLMLEVSPAWTRYLIFDFRFAALSDEKRDGILRLGVNLATGALFDGGARAPCALARRGNRRGDAA